MSQISSNDNRMPPQYLQPQLAPEAQERVKALQERWEQENEGTLTQEIFSIIHGDSFTSGSDYEGGNSLTQINYWLSQCRLWKEDKTEVKPGISLPEINQLEQTLTKAKKALELINDKNTDGLISYIQENLDKDHSCDRR